MTTGNKGGCEALDNALEVEAASRIPAANLNDPSRAQLLLNGAIADFECAFGAYTVMSGPVGEELVDATQTADRWPYERREVQPTDRRYGEFGCESIGVYTPLSTARWSAESWSAAWKGGPAPTSLPLPNVERLNNPAIRGATG